MKIYFSLWIVAALLVFLPIYWGLLRSQGARTWGLLAFSAVVIATLHPVFLVVMVGVTVLILGLTRSLHGDEGWVTSKGLLLSAIGLGVALLACGKYGTQLATALWGGDRFSAMLIMPLGISYFAFRVVQYAIDQARGERLDTAPQRVLLYLFFLPTFPAGPLETLQGFYKKRCDAFPRELVVQSLYRILLGYFKKVVIVDLLFVAAFGGLYDLPLSTGAVHPLAPWGFVVVMFLRAYFDLSAYTDLAIGFSGLFGFRICENFNLPFLAKGPADFWRRWHISLSSWCARNVYFPVFGWTRKPILALYCSMLVMGLWHHVNLNWLAWAIYHGTALALWSRWEGYKRKRKALRKRLNQRAFRYCTYSLTFFFVALGYSFVATQDISTAGRIAKDCLLAPLNLLRSSWGG